LAELEFVPKPYIKAETTGAELSVEVGAAVHGLYYLCVGADSKFALEIVEGTQLTKPLYDKKRYRVIGVAGGRKDAFELVRRVTEEFIASGHRIEDFKDYLLDIREIKDAD